LSLSGLIGEFAAPHKDLDTTAARPVKPHFAVTWVKRRRPSSFGRP
jgi:hypothetical protein